MARYVREMPAWSLLNRFNGENPRNFYIMVPITYIHAVNEVFRVVQTYLIIDLELSQESWFMENALAASESYSLKLVFG